MRLKLLGLLALVGLLGWGLLLGCGGTMPEPPQQDQTPMTADQSEQRESQQSQTDQQTDGPNDTASQGQQSTDAESSQTASTSETPTEKFSAAKEIIRQQSCGSCHTIQAQGLDLTGKVGPDLSAEGDRGRADAWLRRHLMDPTSIPDEEVVEGFAGMQATMPSYKRRLSDEQIDRLVAFLQSLSAADDAQTDQTSPRDGEKPESTQAGEAERERAPDDQTALAKQVIRQQGCGSCHTIQAQGLNLTGQVGPDLTTEGARGRSDAWLRRQIKTPASIPDSEVVEGFEGTQSTMPSYERMLSDDEIDALVAFLQSLRRDGD